jgi:MSHA pilin protein MshA
MKKSNEQNQPILTSEAGFTLIEIIMVIVILGILAVAAIPKYTDMQTKAKEAAADGVYGAAQGGAAINFAAGLVGATQPAGAAITTGALILGALDGTPEGWIADEDTTRCGGTNSGCICLDGEGGTANDSQCGSETYIIELTTDESATAKAVLGKNW